MSTTETKDGGAASTPAAPIRVRLPGAPAFAGLHDGPDVEAVKAFSERVRAFILGSLQMQHLAVLAGSGASLGAGGPRMGELWESAVDAHPKLLAIARTRLRYETSRAEGNIEEFLSRCDAVLGLGESPVVAKLKRQVIGLMLQRCRSAGRDDNALHAHREFLRKLARRRARDSRLQIFTTNYDVCFERAAGSIGLTVLDGFSFSFPRVYDPRFFEHDIVVRGPDADSNAFVPGVFQFFKLHGSVDWRWGGGRVVIDPEVNAEDACLVYPARAKYQRAFQQPHLELMARYLTTLRRPNTCLLVIGFGFADDHLSEPVLSALQSNPHLRVMVVDPTAEARCATGPGNGTWQRLAASADVAVFNARFQDFVPLIPDLKALSPAEQLERTIASVRGGSS